MSRRRSNWARKFSGGKLAPERIAGSVAAAKDAVKRRRPASRRPFVEAEHLAKRYLCDVTESYHKVLQRAINAGLASGRDWTIFDCIDGTRKPVASGKPENPVQRQRKPKVKRDLAPPKLSRLQKRAFRLSVLRGKPAGNAPAQGPKPDVKGPRSAYADYLESPLWCTIRQEVLERDKGICQACFREASQVHHLNYDRAVMLGHDLSALVSICRPCHRAIEFEPDGQKRSVAQSREAYYRLRDYYAKQRGARRRKTADALPHDHSPDAQ